MNNTVREKNKKNFRIETENENTIIKEITDFDLEQTLECGQCFRFYKQDFGPELLEWRFLLLRTVCHNNALVLFFQGNTRALHNERAPVI